MEPFFRVFTFIAVLVFPCSVFCAEEKSRALSPSEIEVWEAYMPTNGKSNGINKPSKIPNEQQKPSSTKPVRVIDNQDKKSDQATPSEKKPARVIDKQQEKIDPLTPKVKKSSQIIENKDDKGNQQTPAALKNLQGVVDSEKSKACQSRPGRAPEMVIIPAGTFKMGSPESDTDASDAEKPQHPVTINRPFSIGRCEVTFADYDVFAKATGHDLPVDEGWGRKDRPVINVSWEDAQAYARWLSQATGRRYRLPTEAEWEYAARGNNDPQMRYPWGDEIGTNQANCYDCGSQWDTQTAPVGSFASNAFGLYDTAGNVWEWVQDCWHDNYQNAPANGTAWKEADQGNCGRRVLRGGSWYNGPGNLRSAARNSTPPDFRDSNIGFRLAQDLN